MTGNRSVIACRLGSYKPFEEGALEHIASLGLRHVEIGVPRPEALDATAAELERFGLRASSLHGECDLVRPDVDRQIADQMMAFDRLGCRIMFTSVRRGDIPFKTACERLRAAGAAAAQRGVSLSLETHPDLVTNAEVGLRTMQGVDHAHVRVNFDTANVYFYNQGVDAVGQLRALMPYVASVHLKDTDGGYRKWHFPALGEGIVDFAGVFQLLDAAGFRGPCTLEIEGIEGEERTGQLIHDRIAASVEHLRALGRL